MKLLLSGIAMVILMASLTFTSCSKSSTKIAYDTTLVTPETDTAGLGIHISDSLWAYFPFNGNILDSSGNGHVLTLDSGVALGYDLWGNAGGALDFPGGSALGQIADGASFNYPNFSISLFAMPRTTSGFFISKVNYANADGGALDIGVDPAYSLDTLRAALATNTDICSAGPTQVTTVKDPNIAIHVDSWYHVVLTFANGTANFYVNGTLVNTQTISTTQLFGCSGAPFILGNWWIQDHNPAFNGKLDDLRIYTRALTANEVSYLYRTFTGRWNQ